MCSPYRYEHSLCILANSRTPSRRRRFEAGQKSKVRIALHWVCPCDYYSVQMLSYRNKSPAVRIVDMYSIHSIYSTVSLRCRTRHTGCPKSNAPKRSSSSHDSNIANCVCKVSPRSGRLIVDCVDISKNCCKSSPPYIRKKVECALENVRRTRSALGKY